MSTLPNQYTHLLASSVTDLLIAENRIKASERDVVVTLIDGVVNLVDSTWKSLISNSVAASASKSKSRKTRRLSAYNMFVKSESPAIRVGLGDGAKVRGAVMTEAGKRWKALDADGQAPYVSQAAEFNANISACKSQSTKSKPSKPRKRTAYNMFVKSQNTTIRADLGADAKLRGAFMTEAGKRWKALDADGRAPYVSQAAEFNAQLVANAPVNDLTTTTT
jgi:hypothetical protein